MHWLRLSGEVWSESTACTVHSPRSRGPLDRQATEFKNNCTLISVMVNCNEKTTTIKSFPNKDCDGYNILSISSFEKLFTLVRETDCKTATLVTFKPRVILFTERYDAFIIYSRFIAWSVMCSASVAII